MKKIVLFVLLLSSFTINAQYSLTENDINEYEIQVNQMVNYLQETLNFIGNPNNSVQEKDVIFKESYSKIFKDENVQVEDDLDENRSTVINKDVQAYLKDVDFFFHNVTFDYEIQDITHQINEYGNNSFKVSMLRTLRGLTLTGDTVNNVANRFLEINLDTDKKELKIVSFYTTKPNAKEELFTWWNSMSKPWKNYFGKNFFVYDSVNMCDINLILSDSYTIMTKKEVLLQDTFMIVGNDTMTMDRIDELYGHKPDTIVFIDDVVSRWINDTVKADLSPIYESLRQMTKMTEVNVSGNVTISNLNPLAELSDLRYLDCSNTEVDNVNPIRNLNKIKDLNISNTKITDVSNLRYANGVQNLKADSIRLSDISIVAYFKDLINLSLSATDIYDIKALAECQNMMTLDISNTQVNDLSPLKDLYKLYDLDISGTFVHDLSPIQGLVNLHFINLENTQVVDMSYIKNIDALNEINFSNTKVTDITPLNNMSHLKKIYCDNSLVSKTMADAYKAQNPNVLVINETNVLVSWWNELPSFWKAILMEQSKTGIKPTKEELHSIINIRNLKVGHYVQDVTPVGRLTNLEYLDLSDSKIDDITPLNGLHNLKSLNINNTVVANLTPLAKCKNLRELYMENTKVESLAPLQEIDNISKVYADGSNITTDEVAALKKVQRQVSVIYQTDDLRLWWGNLNDSWRSIFNDHLLCNANPTAEQLQNIVDLEEISIDPNNIIYTLEPLSQMIFLRKLMVDNNRVHDLSPLSDKYLMEVLSISGNPVDNLLPLSNLTMLKNLNIENTLVNDLSPIAGLKNIKVLNIAGTSVKNLKHLAGFESLEDLSIINTNVNNIEVLIDLPSLKHLKAYKTKIKEKNINLIISRRPELNVIYFKD